MAVEAAVGVATHVVVVVAVVVVVVAVEYGKSSCRGISSGGRCFESSGCSSCSVVVGLARAKIGIGVVGSNFGRRRTSTSSWGRSGCNGAVVVNRNRRSGVVA